MLMSYLPERQFVYEPTLWLSGFRTDVKTPWADFDLMYQTIFSSSSRLF